jgi:DNA mismatch endonuclease (patch repair protein)
MPGRKVAIFVHGCFWHFHEGCRYAKMPSTRPEFWQAKLRANVDRDRLSIEKLNMMGWRVLCVWECATRNAETASGLQDSLQGWIDGDAQFGEISGAMPR